MIPFRLLTQIEHFSDFLITNNVDFLIMVQPVVTIGSTYGIYCGEVRPCQICQGILCRMLNLQTFQTLYYMHLSLSIYIVNGHA